MAMEFPFVLLFPGQPCSTGDREYMGKTPEDASCLADVPPASEQWEELPPMLARAAHPAGLRPAGALGQPRAAHRTLTKPTLLFPGGQRLVHALVSW